MHWGFVEWIALPRKPSARRKVPEHRHYWQFIAGNNLQRIYRCTVCGKVWVYKSFRKRQKISVQPRLSA
jgi:hypothetical protein